MEDDSSSIEEMDLARKIYAGAHSFIPVQGRHSDPMQLARDGTIIGWTFKVPRISPLPSRYAWVTGDGTVVPDQYRTRQRAQEVMEVFVASRNGDQKERK